MATRAAKNALFDGLVVAAEALASGRRAEIVDVLAQGERSVEEIAAEIDQSVANTSHHLQRLARAGLVSTRRAGNRIYYALSSPRVVRLWADLREVAAEHHAEVRRLAAAYLGDRANVEIITRVELSRRLADRNVVVLDVRPEAEYRAGHVAGARSAPIGRLTAGGADLVDLVDLVDLPADAEIVAYCRGPYCVYADDAVRALRSAGHHAVRLEDGYPEWVLAGLPIAAGA